jgi:hypothetical protein
MSATELVTYFLTLSATIDNEMQYRLLLINYYVYYPILEITLK